MKNITYILSLAVLLLSLGACSEDKMDEINENLNDSKDMRSDYIIPDLITSTAFSVVGSDLAFYASAYIEHSVGIYGQLYNAEIRSSEPTSGTTYNNSWVTIYNNLGDLKTVIAKCSAGGEEEGNTRTLGIAQVLTAYNLAVLTDLFGDVPWTEALQPGVIFTPKLDKQEAIYNDIFKLLDDAIANLEKETPIDLGDQDLIYGGDKNSWIAFANGLKARYTMRIAKGDADYQKIISLADESFTEIAEEAKFNYPENASSPFFAFLNDRNYFGASTSLKAKLSLRNDPRDTLFFKPVEGAIVLAPNGKPEQKQGVYSTSALSVKNASTYLLSYHEVQFLKAEAYLRLATPDNDKAKEALKKAVVAALSKANTKIDADDAADYFDNVVEGRFNAKPLEEVMVQKYIAFYEEEAIEAYNDVRRLKAKGENFIQLSHPEPNNFPLRFTYGSSDITTNPNVRNAYGDGSYVYTEKVWWAGGSR